MVISVLCFFCSLSTIEQTEHTQNSLRKFLYLKTTHGTKTMWSYIAGGLKITVLYLAQKKSLWDKIKRSYDEGWS